MDQKKSSKNAAGIFEPFVATDVPWEYFARGERFGCRFRQLGDYGGASHVGVALEELSPGKQACPNHYHMLEEEHLYVLDGNMNLHLGETTYELAAGSYVCFPAGQKVGHSLVNNSDAVCRYLIIGERNPHDVIVYPESERVSVRLMGEGYRKSASMDYWDGIDDHNK